MIEHADIARKAADAHVSTQQAARTARYAFFARAARLCGADKIATGHTQDDQVETVLLHILRGTGLDGLRGIPARRGLYVRPLLGVTRTQVESYCAAHALAPRRDSSNTDPSHYTRNRVRLELLPLLARDYHPGTRNSLLRLSQIAEADADFLQTHAEQTLEQVILTQTNSPAALTLSRARLRPLHPALLRHVLRAAIVRARGTSENITHRHWQQISDAVHSPSETPWALTLPAPLCRAVVDALTLTLSQPEDTDTPIDSSCFALPAPGDTVELPGSGQRVRAALSAISPLPPFSRDMAVFDIRQVHLPTLHVRFWRTGDRIAPRGMAGHTKKLQDIFVDAHVPRRERPRVPIVADRDGLLWVAGLTAADRGHITPETRQCLVLTTFSVRLPD